MTWEDAKKACAYVLANGWRLPTKDELNILYENKDKIGGFADNYYWSSTEPDDGDVWVQDFSDGYPVTSGNSGDYYVRAVRAFSTIKESVKIGNLEVMTVDLGRGINWKDAKKACADLGGGWRLPTKDELNVLYENKDKIGGFADDSYWSSTEFVSKWVRDGVWKQSFYSGPQGGTGKADRCCVRAVRSI